MDKQPTTRQKLLDTALNLIWSSSYGNVTVDDICKAGGISKSSFYHFFKSKSELAVAAYQSHWENAAADYNRIFSTLVAPLDRLRNYCAYVEHNMEQGIEKTGKMPGCPYSLVGAELSLVDETMRQQVQKMFGGVVRFIEQALRDAQHEGSIDPSFDPHTMAEDLYSFILGLLLQAKVRNDVKLLHRLEPTIMAMIGARTSTPTN
jgi:TetR/AcrR family transcriptional regulator, transcriptional repressor for nem operon